MGKNYSNIAEERFNCGYSCAQSVLVSFCDEINLDEQTVLKLASSFGGGMGRMREVCGAVSAMFMIAGLLNGYTEPNNDVKKQAHYRLIQNLAKEFKEEFGSIICRELLGTEGGDKSPIPTKRTNEYYAERSCTKYVKYAAELIYKNLIRD